MATAHTAAKPTHRGQADAAVKVLHGSGRAQVKRLHASVLVFYLVDALLLTGYGAAGTLSPHVGWLYGLLGCGLAGPVLVWFWRRGGRMADLSAASLVQTVLAAAVMLSTLGFAPQVGGVMLMSMMAVLALSAVQLNGRHLLALCVLLALGSVHVLGFTGASAGVPTATGAERLLTGLWLAWLMAKASAHNIVGARLRELVSEANARLAQALQELEKVASTDELTVLPNRRSIMAQLRQALADERQGGSLVGVALLDIDGFKTVNDRHGHDTGDEVLRMFGELALRSLRPADRVGRYGGEEFLLVMRQMRDAPAATDAAERVRAGVEAHDWSAVAPGLAVTVSAGVTLVQQGEDGAAAIRRADMALYDAKRRGRNRVVFRSARGDGSVDEDAESHSLR